MERCQSCEVMTINGIRAHEHGCPEAWKEKKVECWECGFEYLPEERIYNKTQALCPDCKEHDPIEYITDEELQEA